MPTRGRTSDRTSSHNGQEVILQQQEGINAGHDRVADDFYKRQNLQQASHFRLTGGGRRSFLSKDL
jgi:hypothetical protein